MSQTTFFSPTQRLFKCLNCGYDFFPKNRSGVFIYKVPNTVSQKLKTDYHDICPNCKCTAVSIEEYFHSYNPDLKRSN